MREDLSRLLIVFENYFGMQRLQRGHCKIAMRREKAAI